MYRRTEYDKDVSKELHNPIFAQAYMLEMLRGDEFTAEEVLKIVARRMGTTEFSKFVGEKKSNVANFVNGKRKLKEETLNKYLKPFKLKIVTKIQKVA
jgi:hypothetical protein